MARCRKCNAEIPDGQELCSECEKENSESYSDGLPRFAVSEEADTERPPEGFDVLFGGGEALNDPFHEELPEEGSGYNIFEDDAAEELEFDRMLRGIAQDAGEARAKEADVSAPDSGEEAFRAEAELQTGVLSEEAGRDAGEPEAEEAVFPEQFEMPEPEDGPAGGISFDGTEDEGQALAEEPEGGLNDLLGMEADHMENDIFSIPDSMGAEPEEPMQEDEDGLREDDLTAMAEEMPTEEKTDDDILDLINSIYNSEFEEGGEPSGHSGAEEPEFGAEAASERAGGPEDIEDVFSDTLSVMNSLNDAEQADGEEAAQPGKEKKKAKKAKKEKEPKEKKPGFFKRVFGNIKEERSEEEIAALKEKVVADAEAKAAAEEAKAKQAAAQKEEKKKKAAEAKTEAAKKKQEKAKQKAEAAKQKKEEKDRKKQEIQNLIDAIDEDEGRINRVGASIVFVLFAVIAAVVIIGTRMSSYSNSIANAENYFENRYYNEAYNEVAGLDKVKKEDQTFVLQVTTVMITYKQLNSFNNYYAMELYPEALDSLIKGIQRYDEYSGIASVIEVDRDLDYIRGRLAESLEVFGLTERDARALAAIEDQGEYTARVYEIAGRLER